MDNKDIIKWVNDRQRDLDDIIKETDMHYYGNEPDFETGYIEGVRHMIEALRAKVIAEDPMMGVSTACSFLFKSDLAHVQAQRLLEDFRQQIIKAGLKV